MAHPVSSGSFRIIHIPPCSRIYVQLQLQLLAAMAAENAPSFEDLSKVPSPNDNGDDDVPEVRLDPGESFVGTLRHREKGVGKYKNTVLHLSTVDGEPVKMWSNRTIDTQLESAHVKPGDWIGVQKDAEPYTFTDDEGNEREAYGFDVRVSEVRE